MKSEPQHAARRPYRQGARAQATEETGRRILDAFVMRLRETWFDEITLEAVARDAGVTVQTVLRRFGGKEGLLNAARDHFGDQVRGRRGLTPGDIRRAVEMLIGEYEADGDIVMRMLAQEDRHPALRVVSDYGRAEHRDWVAKTFAAWLELLAPRAQQARLDALVVATDLYVWKLVRRDMGRSLDDLSTIMISMIEAAIGQPVHTPTET